MKPITIYGCELLVYLNILNNRLGSLQTVTVFCMADLQLTMQRDT